MTNSVTFPQAYGGDGSTVTDDASPTTGLANGGHRLRFVPSLSNIVAIAAFIVSQVAAAASSAASAVNAPGTSATSTTSNTIVSSGNLNFTLAQTNKAFAIGQSVSIAATANAAAQRMVGVITAFTPSTGAMTVAIGSSVGSGTVAAWTIALAADAATSAAVAALQARVIALETSAIYEGETAFEF